MKKFDENGDKRYSQVPSIYQERLNYYFLLLK